MVAKIKKGEPIKAKFLNELGDGVNKLEELINKPRQVDELPPADVSDADPTANPDYVFSETRRTTTTVQIFDQNEENYAEIERIESVTFENSKGQIFSLEFNND